MRKIIALGGGGFSMKPENPLLDWYILRQEKRKPNQCSCQLSNQCESVPLAQNEQGVEEIEWERCI